MSRSYHDGLRDLNALTSPEDTDVDTLNPDDLAIFTNTRFFDFDMAPENEQQRARPVNQQEDDPGDPLAEGELIDPNLKGGSMDFLNDYDPFSYASFSLNDIPHSSSGELHENTPTPSTVNIDFSDASGSMIAPHATTGGSYHPPAPLSDSASPTPFPITPSCSSRGVRVRKASTASSSEPLQSPTSGDNFGFGGDGSESGKNPVADEDKRRRNTAASARFRVKKKQREQDLEKRAKDGEEKVRELENKIKQLQTENTWLKDLLMEKNTSKESAAPVSKQKAGAKDGVGTKGDA